MEGRKIASCRSSPFSLREGDKTIPLSTSLSRGKGVPAGRQYPLLRFSLLFVVLQKGKSKGGRTGVPYSETEHGYVISRAVHDVVFHPDPLFLPLCGSRLISALFQLFFFFLLSLGSFVIGDDF